MASAASLLALAGFGYAQFPPTPEGVTVLDSRFGDGVQLSWKEVRLSCEASIVSIADTARTISARLPRAFAATLAMSIFRLAVWTIWAKSRIILLIRSSGL